MHQKCGPESHRFSQKDQRRSEKCPPNQEIARLYFFFFFRSPSAPQEPKMKKTLQICSMCRTKERRRQDLSQSFVLLSRETRRKQTEKQRRGRGGKTGPSSIRSASACRETWKKKQADSARSAEKTWKKTDGFFAQKKQDEGEAKIAQQKNSPNKTL
jgi:hypothetical protein